METSFIRKFSREQTCPDKRGFTVLCLQAGGHNVISRYYVYRLVDIMLFSQYYVYRQVNIMLFPVIMFTGRWT